MWNTIENWARLIANLVYRHSRYIDIVPSLIVCRWWSNIDMLPRLRKNPVASVRILRKLTPGDSNRLCRHFRACQIDHLTQCDTTRSGSKYRNCCIHLEDWRLILRRKQKASSKTRRLCSRLHRFVLKKNVSLQPTLAEPPVPITTSLCNSSCPHF